MIITQLTTIFKTASFKLSAVLLSCKGQAKETRQQHGGQLKLKKYEKMEGFFILPIFGDRNNSF